MLSRTKFFCAHLLFSIIMGFIAYIIIYHFWYPFPLAEATGVTDIFLMLLVIHIIIGPIITLIVNKKNKKTLKLDLTLIILLQMIAFIFGFYSIAQGRPVWIVFNKDKFELIRLNDLVDTDNSFILLNFKNPSWLGPKFVAIKDYPQSQKLINQFLGGLSPAQYPKHYIPLNDVKLLLKTRGQELKNLEGINSKKKIEKIINKYPNANSWFPLYAKEKNMVVLINKNKGQIIQVVNLEP